MSQYILLYKIEVQNANAIAGFTWGFPAITHFLGFTHNLSRKLSDSEEYSNISLLGCAVISHKHHVNTYDNFGKRFSQLKTCAYLDGDVKKAKDNKLSIIEEGKMNMTVSLLIEYEGSIGGRKVQDFIRFLTNACLRQRLAGGTILDIEEVQRFDLTGEEANTNLQIIKRKLLPGFLLQDRSHYLKAHYEDLKKKNSDVELLDAWLDFIYLKHKARPKSHLISQHLEKLEEREDQQLIYQKWQQHLAKPYQEGSMPIAVVEYFKQLESTDKALTKQWQEYVSPTENTEADWEYVPKPQKGYLVPIMTGYKAISKVYNNEEIENTRDSETKVCFVESTHSIGEWQSVHRMRKIEELSKCIWKYHYEEGWYQCKQGIPTETEHQDTNEDNEF